MTLQEKSLRTLELHKVLELLAEQTQTDLARERALSLRPETVLSRCEILQQQCADAVHLMGLFGSPSFDVARRHGRRFKHGRAARCGAAAACGPHDARLP